MMITLTSGMSEKLKKQQLENFFKFWLQKVEMSSARNQFLNAIHNYCRDNLIKTHFLSFVSPVRFQQCSLLINSSLILNNDLHYFQEVYDILSQITDQKSELRDTFKFVASTREIMILQLVDQLCQISVTLMCLGLIILVILFNPLLFMIGLIAVTISFSNLGRLFVIYRIKKRIQYLKYLHNHNITNNQPGSGFHQGHIRVGDIWDYPLEQIHTTTTIIVKFLKEITVDKILSSKPPPLK
jgi:hypothetical protein